MSIRQFFRQISFILWYCRTPPWEHGEPPPELEHFILENAPGRALDLGCGSGTSSLALARVGWAVTGVDFTPSAIRRARSKAKAAGLSLDLRLGDVTHLPQDISSLKYDLVLDIGCFHTLDSLEKSRYLATLPHLLAPGGTWLLYGFFSDPGWGGVGLLEEEIQEASQVLDQAWRQDGFDRKNRRSAWIRFRKAD